jgi:hypothetical protein
LNEVLPDIKDIESERLKRENVEQAALIAEFEHQLGIQ